MKYSILLVTCIMCLSVSCKKEKLEGDSAILKGTWKWTSTDQVTNACEDDSLWNFVAFDSSYANNEFSIEFLEKGKIHFFHNGGLIVKNRIVFESKNTTTLNPYTLHFFINPNNDESEIMEGFVGENDLLLFDFPKDTDNSCEERYNYFTKE